MKRDTLRQSIDGESLLWELKSISQALQSGRDISADEVTGEPVDEPLSDSRAKQLSKAAEIHLRLLAKVLPDVRAVELSGPDGAELGSGDVDRLALATKLLAVWREQAAQAVVAAEPVQPALEYGGEPSEGEGGSSSG